MGEEGDEMTFEDAVLKELGEVKDMVLKDDYLREVVAKAVGTPLTSDDIAKAVGGSALYTAQQETLELVKSLEKQLTTMQNAQTELVKAVAALHKEVPEEEEEVPPEPVPEEEKQLDEEKVPKEVVPPEPVPEEEEKQVNGEEEVPPEPVPEEEEKQVDEEEEDMSKSITADTPWEKVHSIAKLVRPY